MGFFFGGSKKNSKVSTKRIISRTTNRAPLKKALEPTERPESTLTLEIPSDTESLKDDESEIFIDDLPKGAPKYYGENESHDNDEDGSALVDGEEDNIKGKVILTGKLPPMSFVSVSKADDGSVVSGLS